jgi:hypothetical protein
VSVAEADPGEPASNPARPVRPVRLYVRALRTTVRASAAPYGYTVTVWTSGGALIHFHGQPTIGDLFLFVAGAVLAFAAVALVSRAFAQQSLGEQSPPQLIGAFHVGSVGAALGAVIGLGSAISGDLAWMAGAFVATAVYLVTVALQLTLAQRWAGASYVE